MSNKRAFLTGDNEIDQLHKIFRCFGTPNVDDWPEIVNMPYWRNNFPTWEPLGWQLLVPNLSPEGVDLMEKLFRYNPDSRITAAAALEHPYCYNYKSNTFAANGYSLQTPSPQVLHHKDVQDGTKEKEEELQSVQDMIGDGQIKTALSFNNLTAEIMIPNVDMKKTQNEEVQVIVGGRGRGKRKDPSNSLFEPVPKISRSSSGTTIAEEAIIAVEETRPGPTTRRAGRSRVGGRGDLGTTC